MITLSSRASKQASTWHGCMTNPKFLSAQSLDQGWIRLARKGFWGCCTAMSCRVSFRSCWWELSCDAFCFLLHFLPSNPCYRNNLVKNTVFTIVRGGGQFRWSWLFCVVICHFRPIQPLVCCYSQVALQSAMDRNLLAFEMHPNSVLDPFQYGLVHFPASLSK